MNFAKKKFGKTWVQHHAIFFCGKIALFVAKNGKMALMGVYTLTQRKHKNLKPSEVTSLNLMLTSHNTGYI